MKKWKKNMWENSKECKKQCDKKYIKMTRKKGEGGEKCKNERRKNRNGIKESGIKGWKKKNTYGKYRVKKW